MDNKKYVNLYLNIQCCINIIKESQKGDIVDYYKEEWIKQLKEMQRQLSECY